ncbi:MAG TPA: calcium-binding protein [Solirubrobacterales bacterium]|jgi:Ca2+-binding RTX toxin-like protein|nr:calcium-binding protein [Solirubrobacterales bacterium]
MKFFFLALVFLGLAATAAPAATAGSAPPSCAEGPVRVGEAIVGTPCGDRIVAPPGVARVLGGGGDDTILAAPLAAASCPEGCFLGVGSQTFEGGPGDDVVYGQRGNDTLRGGEGSDRLYGGIGDDLLQGGPGDDLLAGGFGADSIDGAEGNDYVRGDSTIDRIFDGGGGFDTLSYGGGVTPGFGAGIATGAANFPGGAEGERGVFLDLSSGGENGNDGIAALGGGVDEVQPGAFERIVGTPYSDFIVGSAAPESIDGGGGADVIHGEGGDDALLGGADGDYLEGGGGSDTVAGEAGSDNCVGEAQTGCEGAAAAVQPRDTTKVSVGITTSVPGLSQVYLTGSGAGETIGATYSAGAVAFTLSGAVFDQSTGAVAGCAVVTSTQASCPLAAALDSVVLAGMGGADTIEAVGFPASTGVVLSGGAGDDSLTGGEASEDVLVDGPGGGEDRLSSLGGDDALLHNGGGDELLGGTGNDLFLSVSICDGELLAGGAGRDNASWARLTGADVDARLDQGRVGEAGPGEAPQCSAGGFDTLQEVEDLEGSNSPDVLYGDAGPNQLLGHAGADTYRALAGDDSILANSADSDAAVDCGEGNDSALIDVPNPPAWEDPAPIACESVRTAAPNNFETQTELPPPAPAPPPPVVRRDTRPPRTLLTHHPRALLLTAARRRRVVFAFASDEPGSRFRCRLDRRPYAGCASPRAYTVGLGLHALRVFAVDPAGNADATPARFAFRVRRRAHRAPRARPNRTDPQAARSVRDAGLGERLP